MLKKRLLICFPLLLSGCSSDNPYSIKVINNYETVTENKEYLLGISLSANDVCKMIETRQTFPLFIYSNSCEPCNTFKGVLEQYVGSYNTHFYKYESKTESNTILLEKYPDFFLDNLSTPSLITFNEGELVYIFQNSKMTSFAKFRPVAKSHLKSTSITTLFDTDTFAQYINDKQDFILFTYDSSLANGLENYKNIFDNAKKSNKETLLLDLNKINFSNLFGESNFMCQIYENGQIKSVTADDASINDLINSYYLEEH